MRRNSIEYRDTFIILHDDSKAFSKYLEPMLIEDGYTIEEFCIYDKHILIRMDGESHFRFRLKYNESHKDLDEDVFLYSIKTQAQKE